ncbi:hypothetical protein TRFO_37219 [Tritrichomonas foetus]|uniref:Uncharacterized protein n=1 Tax=Tritrichomonas foetus TaxID=1144522 RepID=A0A1J4JBP8_9EUKA|nr:hypothetical protein TRFO_37219 [Tritrichomonas foetus]|eukprot:OHS96606.1 hypothetical protein TRFO_37219 [Tritrichomonas foetus]
MSSSLELVCSSQRDKSFWISTFASFGSSFLLLSFLMTMMYFSLWRNKAAEYTFLSNISHLSFIIALFMKSIGSCAAGIILRYDNIKWVVIRPILVDVPQAALVVSYSIVFLTWCIASCRQLTLPVGKQITRISGGALIASLVFFLANSIFDCLYFSLEKEQIHQLNVWISFARDEIIGIAFLVILSLVRKFRNVSIKGNNNTEKSANIQSIVVLASLLVRGITILVENFVFSPKYAKSETTPCGIPSLAFYIGQQLVCEVLPAFSLISLQGSLSKILSYETLE